MTVGGRLAVLVPAVVVGVTAVVATAHGGYEVAVASQVPTVVAWTYPVITDGLALVAYAATRRLTGAGLVHAWAVVTAAAGLSGLAQAVYLASGPALVTSPALRFGVGAWPAVAGAVTAHLVFLLAHHRDPGLLGGGGQVARPHLVPDVSPTAPTPPAAPTPPTGTGVVAENREGAPIPAGVGRRRLAKKLGVSEHAARQLLARG